MAFLASCLLSCENVKVGYLRANSGILLIISEMYSRDVCVQMRFYIHTYHSRFIPEEVAEASRIFF
jgi:hypothetical protein